MNMDRPIDLTGGRGKHVKPRLCRLGIFGANAHVGRPLAREILRRAPDTQLRLIIRAESHRASLKAEFPHTDLTIANYYDLSSLEPALDGLDGLFVITPDFLDEERAMTNLIYAARSNPRLIQIVRLLADPPGMTWERVPDALKRFGSGMAIQHLHAKEILERSGLPVTYINVASYFMQNFITQFNGPIRSDRILALPRNRRMGFIDTVDVAACAAALLLSSDQRHIGQVYNLDNGHDIMWLDQVAAVMSAALNVEIRYDGSDETFARLCGDGVRAYLGRPDAVEYFLEYFQFEQDNETVWRKSDIVEYLTGWPATKLYDWLKSHRREVLGG